VGVVRFVVLDVHAALLEQVPSPVREADLHDRVAAPVGDEDSRRSRQLRLPVLDDRNEAREGEDPCRRRTVRDRARARSSSPSPSRSRRAPSAPASDPAASRSRRGSRPAAGRRRERLGVALDARDDVPVITRAAEGESAARSDDGVAARVEVVAERGDRPSSAPRPWWSTRSPAGSPTGGRSRNVR
jgi:hypothetical protein